MAEDEGEADRIRSEEKQKVSQQMDGIGRIRSEEKQKVSQQMDISGRNTAWIKR